MADELFAKFLVEQSKIVGRAGDGNQLIGLVTGDNLDEIDGGRELGNPPL